MSEEIPSSYLPPKFEKEPEGTQEFSQVSKRSQEEELPILKYKAEIGEMIFMNPTTIIVGETGSGKTTQIPLIVWELLGSQEKVAITQPRRLATRSVSSYVAKKLGCQIGEEVGYQIRFEDRTTEGTRINFMTDGILLRKIQEDPLLREYSAVMVDEAHERSLNIDFVLGLLKRLQRKRREAGLPPLKIIVTSATLEKEKFAQYFGDAPILEIPGRLYPVEIHYENGKVYDYTSAAAEKVKSIISENKEGDILVFMPGQEEISRTIQNIQELNLEETEALPLYGEMDPEEQDKIFAKTDKRKIVVATNIAETSVTVPGIRHVIDSGLIKQINYNPSTGIETLELCLHSKSGCIQRAGRAGRLAPGECWRLYTETDFADRQEFQTPEIKRSNLAHVVLMMKKIGIEDVNSFEFIDPPRKEALEEAIETLKTLGAFDENEEITELGKLMVELPLEPRLAKMVIEAEKYNCVEAICTIAAFLGERPVFIRPKGREGEADLAHQTFKVAGSDFLSLLKVWQEYEANNCSDSWAFRNFLNSKVLAEVRQIRYQLFRALRRNGIRVGKPPEPESVGKSITASYLDNLLRYEGSNYYRRLKDNRLGIYLHPSSVTFSSKPSLVVAAEIVQTNKLYARMVQEVRPEWLYEVAPHLLTKERRDIEYDEAQDKIILHSTLFLAGFSGSSIGRIQEELSGEEAVEAFAEILVNGRIDLPFVRHNQQVMKTLEELRLRSAGKVLREPFSYQKLKRFYKERLGNISSRRALEEVLERQGLDLELKLDDFLSEEIREHLLQENPDSIEILGRAHPVSYRYDGLKDGFSAWVKITVEEIFKLDEIPSLPSGRTLSVAVVDKEDAKYILASGKDLKELRQRVKEPLIREQWQKWLESEPEAKPKELEDFDPLSSELPTLPEPRQFGEDPETGEPLFAFPAIEAEVSYFTGIHFRLKFFPSREEAERSQDRFLRKVEETRKEKRQQEEKERLSALARELLEKLKKMAEEIGYDYKDEYGLSYVEWCDLNQSLEEAERVIQTGAVEGLEILEKIKPRLEKAFADREEKRRLEELIEEAIKEHCANCPLCGRALEGGLCGNSEHNLDRVKFETDREGLEKSPAVLSQIVTNDGKIVVQLCCSKGRDGHYPGDIYLRKGNRLEEKGWQGEPFEDLRYEDFNRILSEEEAQRIAEERSRSVRIAYYQEEFKKAMQMVERDELNWGKFEKAKHPKTGEEQWERTIKSRGLTIKYIVDRYGPQPTSSDLDYFYSEKRTLVDTPNFKLILVRLASPLPEDAPEEWEAPLPSESGEDSSLAEDSGEEKDIADKLEELKMRWGARQKDRKS